MKLQIYLASLVLACNLSAPAAIVYPGAAAAIPDNNSIGLMQTLTVGGLNNSITTASLSFQLQGGFGTDLTGYLRLGSVPGLSPAYDLTSLVQAQTVISGTTPVNFTVDVSSTFAAQNPNAVWTLFLVDTSSGGQTTLNGWSLNITAGTGVSPVPEPVNIALGVFCGLLGLVTLGRSASVQRMFGKR